MPQRVRSLERKDFTGGLNVVDDAFQLSENETPDCLNVQLLPRGGFQLRNPLVLFSKDPFAVGSVKNIWPFYGTGVPQVVVQTADGLSVGDGAGAFVAVPQPGGTGTISGRSRAASLARTSTGVSYLYVQRNVERQATRFDGSQVIVLTDSHGAYNDVLASPAAGHMPKAKLVVAHANYLFHGWTLEGATSFPSRLRWSHPGEPEDYRTDDWVDVGLDDGDEITALVSFGQALFVFKHRSVWRLSGYDPDTFQLQKIADGVGCVSQEAVVASSQGLFWFDGTQGMFTLGDGRPRWIWQKLASLLLDGSISRSSLDGVTVGWLDNRLFVAVPWDSATVNTRLFVFDLQAGKGGAWYPYEFGSPDSPISVGPMICWSDGPGDRPFCLLVGREGQGVFRLSDDRQLASDDLGYAAFVAQQSEVGGQDVLGGTAQDLVPFRSYLKTAWFAAGMPTVRKRWRRPSFVMDADSQGTIAVDVFHDYAANISRRSLSLAVDPADSGGVLWGSGALWGAFSWSSGSVGDQAIVRGSALGNAYAVQLLFRGPQARWGVNAVAFRYLPKKVR